MSVQSMRFVVCCARDRDIDKAVVWVRYCDPNHQPFFKRRPRIVSIKEEGRCLKKIFLQYREFDKNYERTLADFNFYKKNLSETNENVVFLSEYYRRKLGVEKNREYTLVISPSYLTYPYFLIRAGLQHADNLFRLMMCFSLFSTIVSIYRLFRQ